MDLKNYYLDLDKMFELQDYEQKYIQDLYRDMLFCNEDTSQKSIAMSYFNTLSENGYLTNIREKKLDDLLDE